MEISKFEKKRETITALEEAHNTIVNLIKNEQEWGIHHGDDLDDWTIKQNELAEIRISVYKSLQEYISKQI